MFHVFTLFYIFSILMMLCFSFQEWRLEKIYSQSNENEQLSPSEKAKMAFAYQMTKCNYQTCKIVLIGLMLFITLLFITLR